MLVATSFLRRKTPWFVASINEEIANENYLGTIALEQYKFDTKNLIERTGNDDEENEEDIIL
jgi:hypothetical protein